MKVLVTGSGGLVGSAVKELAKNSEDTFIYLKERWRSHK